jgi:hypothetical protein
MDGVDPYGHRKGVSADSMGLLVTAFADDATVHPATRAGSRWVFSRLVEAGRMTPLLACRVVAGAGPGRAAGLMGPGNGPCGS